MLVQLVKLQQPNSYHRPGRHRRARRFRRFRRYGPTTTTTTTSTTTSTDEPTTTTRVSCQGGNFVDSSGNSSTGKSQSLRVSNLGGLPPRSTVTIESAIDPPDCTCVGGTGGGRFPAGYLYVEVTQRDNVRKDTPIISVTSPNLTEIKLHAVAQTDRIKGDWGAGTTAFNGFSAEGNWTIQFLDSSDNPVSLSNFFVTLDFGIQNCDQILPASSCAGNTLSGAEIISENLSLVNKNISNNTLVQFDVDGPSYSFCCVPSAGDLLVQFQFTNNFVDVLNDFVEGPARNPDSAFFSVNGSVAVTGTGLGLGLFAVLQLEDSSRSGSKASGLWSFSLSTNGDNLTIGNALRNPRVLLSRVGPCP